MTWCASDGALDVARLGELGGVEFFGFGSGEVGAVDEAALLGMADVGALEPVAPGAFGDPLPQALIASMTAAPQMAVIDRLNGHLPRT